MCDKNIDSNINQLKNDIAHLDKQYGVTQRTRHNRARMNEEDKHQALKIWIKLLKAQIKQSRLEDNTLLVRNPEESVGHRVEDIEAELKYYKIRNNLYLENSLLCAYEQCGYELMQREMVEGAHRMYYHRMVALTRFRFAQVKHGKLRRKIEALIRWVMLLFLWQSSDFGRNTLKFIRAIIAVIVFFGLIYTFWGELQLSSGMQPSTGFASKLVFSFYTSLATFFTLGGVDIVPSNPLTRGIMLVEFAIGYIFLGLLVAIISKRLIE